MIIVIILIAIIIAIFRMKTAVTLPMAAPSVVVMVTTVRGIVVGGRCSSGYNSGKGVGGISPFEALLTQAEAAVPSMVTVVATIRPDAAAEKVVVEDATAGAPGGPGHELLGGIGREDERPCPGATGGAGHHARRSSGRVDDIVPVEEGRVADPALPGGGGASSGDASGWRREVGVVDMGGAVGKCGAGTKAGAVGWVEVQTGSSGMSSC